MTTLITYLLAVIGLHRLWNFEHVFHAPRTFLLRYRFLTPITCQACNAFWIAALLGALAIHAPPDTAAAVLQVFAAYAVTRGILWIYRMASHLETVARGKSVPVKAATTAGTAMAASPEAAAADPTKCRTCDEKKADLVAAQKTGRSYEKRIVILTTLANFSPSYSLAGVISDHALMLAQNPTWWIEIWVHEGALLNHVEFPPNVTVKRIVPPVGWKPDEIVASDRDRLATAVRKNLMALGNATVIAHDIIFQRSFTTFAAAIHQIGDTAGFAWLHICHSAVMGRPVTSSESVRFRTTLPARHQLLCLSEAEVPFLAEYYDTALSNVVACPNARDFASFGNVDPRAAAIVKKHGLADADVVQVMPVSATRLKDKGVLTLIPIFAALQQRGLKMRLVLAVAHANGQKERDALQYLRVLADNAGLDRDALIISSDEFPDTAVNGLTPATLRDLFAISNVFIFPTVSEASSLVVLEAALAGCLLVLNESLHTMDPLMPGRDGGAIYWRFGSLRQPLAAPVRIEGVAEAVHRTLGNSIANTGKRAALRNFSHRAIGERLRQIVIDAPITPLRLEK